MVLFSDIWVIVAVVCVGVAAGIGAFLFIRYRRNRARPGLINYS